MSKHFWLILVVLVFLPGCNPVETEIVPTITAVLSSAPLATETPLPSSTPPTIPTSSPTPMVMPTAVTPTPPIHLAPLCSEVTRPALLLATGDQMLITNTTTNCAFNFPNRQVGEIHEAGNTLFYHFSHQPVDGQNGFSEVRYLLPNGTEQSLPFTRVEEPDQMFLGFIPSPDGRFVAWAVGSWAADGTTALSNLYMADVIDGQASTLLLGWEQTEGRFIHPIQIDWDNRLLFFTLSAPDAETWNERNGRYDILYMISEGNTPELLFDCKMEGLTHCLNDFANKGYDLAYIRNTNVVVAYRDGRIIADIPTDADFTGYPLLSPGGDLLYYTAIMEQGDSSTVLGRLYRLPWPYDSQPELIVEEPGLLPPLDWFNETHVVVGYIENSGQGTAVINIENGTLTKVEPGGQAGFLTILPGLNVPVRLTKEFSPDGNWWVRYGTSEFVAVPEKELELYPFGAKYRVFLQVGRTDGSVLYTVVDGWRSNGVGGDYVIPVEWSQVSPALYYADTGLNHGCSYFVANGSNLYRLLLTDGSVAELLPRDSAYNLAISPNEQYVAYIGVQANPFMLMVREIALGFDNNGNPVNTAVTDPMEWRIPLNLNFNEAQVGNLLWSPFAQDDLVLAVVHNPCETNERFSLLRVNLDGTITTLIDQDTTAYTPMEWVRPSTIRLLDNEGKTWLIDVNTADLTPD